METKISNTNKEVAKLKREVRSLRSFVFGVISEDSEGDYKESFIREMKRRSSEKASKSFKNSEQFLNEVKNAQ